MEYRIKERSFIARIAAWKLRSQAVAIVTGHTIHLWKVSKETFLSDARWVRHELCHIRQFQQYGFFTFIFRYLWESILHGYHNNKYEAEARQAEDETN